MRRVSVVLVIAVGLLGGACSNGGTPTGPTTVVTTNTTPVAPAAPVRPTVTGALTFSMPVVSSDTANVAFGLAPFGYHGADHAEDGHPGWDIEYRAGGVVRASADGTVLSVLTDAANAGRTTVQLEHQVGQHFYRTSYTNLLPVNADVVVGQFVTRGQALGVAGSLSTTVAAVPITYSMTHFQIDDFEFYAGGIPNPNAISPEPVLSADGRVIFDRIWPLAVYAHELTEPFATNPRTASFPLTRAWTRESGEGPAGVSFTRKTARSVDYAFAILAESGVAIEAGAVTLRYTQRPLQTIDLVAPTSIRLGIYDIVDDRMRLALGAPGAPRPTDLSAAAVYRTPRSR